MLLAVRVLATMVAFSLLSVCAADELSAQRTPIRVRIPGNVQWTSIDPVSIEPASVPASSVRTYQAAMAALHELKVPVDVDEPANGLLGSGGFTLVRTLGRERLSKYLDCGTDVGGANADLRRVAMALFVWIDSIGPVSSQVKVGVLASARDLQGVSKTVLQCGSTGALEAMLADEIRKRAVMPAV